MSLTILEVLENADYNLQNAKMQMQIELAKSQLHNALKKIDEGKTLEDIYYED
jgi:rRNA maturation endonuclease Nob1